MSRALIDYFLKPFSPELHNVRRQKDIDELGEFDTAKPGGSRGAVGRFEEREGGRS